MDEPSAGLLVFILLVFTVTSLPVAYFILLPFSFFLSGYYSFFLIASQARQDAKRYAISETVRNSINIFLPLLCFYIFNARFALIVLIVSLIISYLIPLMFVLRKTIANNALFFFNRLPGGFKPEIAAQIKNYGLPVAVFLSLSLALNVNDRYIIAEFIDYKSAGTYAAVYDVVSRGVTFVCAPVIMTFYPHIVKEYNLNNKKSAGQSLLKAIALELMIFISGLIAIYFLGTYLLSFLLKDAVPPFMLQLLYMLYCGLFVWQLAMLAHKPLELRLKTKYMAFGVLVAFILNFAINFLLIKNYQNILIAGYTTIGASLLYLVYVSFLSLKFRW